jgi:hypothetical protein
VFSKDCFTAAKSAALPAFAVTEPDSDRFGQPYGGRFEGTNGVRFRQPSPDRVLQSHQNAVRFADRDSVWHTNGDCF